MEDGEKVEEECLSWSVDWRGRPCKAKKHGGMRGAAFVLGVMSFEITAIAAVGNNLITYVFREMHFSLPKSANTVTNFVGTCFLLSLLGGFLSDSYLGTFWTMLLFGFVELSGFILLAVQAHVAGLRPPACDINTNAIGCREAQGWEAFAFYAALYLVALGSGCLKPNVISHGAHQFTSPSSSDTHLPTFFNSAYFAFTLGQLLALTLLVWLQTHSGMDVGLGVSAAAMAVALIILISGAPLYRNKPPPARPLFTPIAQVFVAAIIKWKQVCPSPSNNTQVMTISSGFNTSHPATPATQKFRFLNKACIKAVDDGNYNNNNNNSKDEESPWRLCSVRQVEQVKILLSVLPIFGCTIMFNTILAQLQTFSVQQGSLMDARLTHTFTIPPASLQSIPYIMLLFIVPLYQTSFVPLARRLTGSHSGISPLHRIGVGLFVVTFSMVSAALVEAKRRNAATAAHHEALSIFWIAPQFLIFGVSEMFTAVGLIEFFYMQPSLEGMQSFLTAMTYCSYSFGFYFSSLLVSLVNKITTTSRRGGGWLSHNDLNMDRLDYFYWLLALLSFINFLNYLLCSRCYHSQSLPRHHHDYVVHGELVDHHHHRHHSIPISISPSSSKHVPP